MAVSEIKVIFCASLGCTQFKTVPPRSFLCTPLVYSNGKMVKKIGAHRGHTSEKNMCPAAEMCATGAACTVNFKKVNDAHLVTQLEVFTNLFPLTF